MRPHSVGLLMAAGVVGAGLIAPARGQLVPELGATACDSIGSKNECTLVASCAWVKSCSGTASDPVAHPDCAAPGLLTPSGGCPDGCDLGEMCVVNRGADDCQCIDPYPAQAESTEQCLNATLGDDKQELTTCLPRSYGAGRCDAWDSQIVGLCVDEGGNIPDSGHEPWCQSSWCWVDGTTCQKPRSESDIAWTGDTAMASELFYRFVHICSAPAAAAAAAGCCCLLPPSLGRRHRRCLRHYF